MMRRQDDATEPIQPIGAVRPASLRTQLPNAQENGATSVEADPAGASSARGAAVGAAQGESAARRAIEPQFEAPVAAALKEANLAIAFVKDERTNEMITQLKDPTTGEVIRQVPAEEMLKIAEAIDKYLGLIVDKKS